jgi:NAD(P)H dehydrogenase (quinone)
MVGRGCAPCWRRSAAEVVTRAVWHVCRPMKMRYLALYDMNRATDARRGAFLGRVRKEMGEF